MKTLNPTVEIDDHGTKSWWKNGKLHREENDLHAVEWIDGGKEWWINGILDRENGLPAIESPFGHKAWYLNNVCYRWDEWIDKL